MSRKRRAYEAGHRPKYLVVIDDTPECDRAVYYAARRLARIGGRLVMLRVIATADMAGQWLGVADLMKQEAREAADKVLRRHAERARAVSGAEPDLVVREGDDATEIVRLIDEDEDIAILVLAAGTSKEGPGPLVTLLAGRAVADFPVPIAIVPGHLDDATIDALS